MAPQSPPAISTSPFPAHKLRARKTSEVTPDDPQTVTSPVSPMRSARAVQPRVFARLQALFPPSTSSPRSFPPVPSSNTVTPPLLPPPPPRFIKTRIVTWNMHDSLPKGDLEELLGSVPLHIQRSITDEADRLRIPGLSTDEGHPYHIIVVAGQECPTLSGIPLGLGAMKYKDARDREKEKEKERHKEKDTEKDREKDKSKDKDLLHHTKSILSKHLKHDHTSYPKIPDSPHSDLGLDASSTHSSVPTSGWSAVLEDWFANGVGSLHDVKPVVTGTALDSPAGNSLATPHANGDAYLASDLLKAADSPPNYQLPQTLDVNWKRYDASTTGSESSPTSNLQARMGPYELLIKERLMGMYIAVYIHRDMRPLVRGVSSGAVPAGLIGGRLGNKGGVGVSVDLHGTTLLFINAHLAAHEGKVSLRVANLAKIKAELPVESFLSNDDRRTFAEDLTDRFDHTWIFGDLNFRLDISRLHADWLISRQEYAQAFEFDQLQKLMKDGEPTFAGFHEAKIDFPPTFKYDVLRTLKHDKHKPRKDHKNPKSGLVGVEERDSEAKADELNQEDDEEEKRCDTGSVHSSVWTSNHTRNRSEATDDGDESDPSLTNASAALPVGLAGTPTSLMNHAAFKAKTAWLALLKSSRASQSPPSSPGKRKRRSTAGLSVPGSSIELSRGARATPNASSTSLSAPVLRRATSAKASLAQQKRDSDPLSFLNDKGVYDSSSKKRVPSWCDRILWKTTIEPLEELESEPDIEADHGTSPTRPRGRTNRISQLFHQAFRPRGRRESIQPESPVVPLSVPAHAPLSTSPGLYQSKSLEPAPTPSALQAQPPSPAGTYGRKRSASASVTNGDSVSRRRSMPVTARLPRPLPSPRRAESDQLPSISPPDRSPTPPVTGGRAGPRRWFLNLVSRDHSGPSSITPVTPELLPPQRPQHRRGDVECLSYRTLDDRQMRRLEGRSDHRPVIGSFAIHI